MRSCECPKCSEDISETYEGYDPSVGIMCGGWFCEKCDIAVADEGDDDYDLDRP
jgi:hypothetical protein